MKLTLRKSSVLYLLLLMSFANASLRLNASGFSTFYRLLSPPVVIWIVLVEYKRIGKQFVLFAFLIVYSLIVSIVVYHNVIIAYHINLVYIMAIYLIIFRIRELEANFDDAFFRFLDITTIIILGLAYLQMVVHIAYPFVSIANERTSVNVFFSNENELGQPLACMAIIYMVRHFVNGEKRYFLRTIIIVALLFLVDAKLSLLGVIAGAIMTATYAGLYKKKGRQKGGDRRLFIGCLLILVVIGILSVSNINLKFRDYNISINELLLDYIKRIIKLQSFSSGGGSLIDRTNAIIYGLIEFKKSFFFGIGFGNSTYMLSFPQYRLLTAESMHNLFFQLICEFGYIAIISYIFIARTVLHNIKSNTNWQNVLKLVYCISFILISSQSSIGILSNYMTWTITFYVALFNKKSNFCGNLLNNCTEVS